ncbi:MAG: hypothetical protein F6J93_13115 [Oscillatoria sp. SIO1A7]|nr:hypothetical protein [Oscillatoria sp. SIO1A7]
MESGKCGKCGKCRECGECGEYGANAIRLYLLSALVSQCPMPNAQFPYIPK